MKPQSVSPVGHTQEPAVHVASSGHLLPQVPQLLLSVLRSRHTMPQSVCPEEQPDEHTPPEHVWPAPQLLPHVPQLRRSLEVSTQKPLQLVRPPPHTHAPLAQLAPTEHTLPHVPQSNGSVERSTHPPLQSV